MSSDRRADGQTESDPYEPTVQYAQVDSKRVPSVTQLVFKKMDLWPPPPPKSVISSYNTFEI